MGNQSKQQRALARGHLRSESVVLFNVFCFTAGKQCSFHVWLSWQELSLVSCSLCQPKQKAFVLTYGKMKLLLLIPSQWKNNLAIQLPHLLNKGYEQKAKSMFVTSMSFHSKIAETYLSYSPSLSSLFNSPFTNVSSNFLTKIFPSFSKGFWTLSIP